MEKQRFQIVAEQHIQVWYNTFMVTSLFPDHEYISTVIEAC